MRSERRHDALLVDRDACRAALLEAVETAVADEAVIGCEHGVRTGHKGGDGAETDQTRRGRAGLEGVGPAGQTETREAAERDGPWTKGEKARAKPA